MPGKQHLEAALQADNGRSGSAGKRQYLNAAFWSGFFNSCGFKTPGFHGLHHGDEDEVTLGDDYWEVMGTCTESPSRSDATIPIIALFHVAAHSRLVTLKMAYRMSPTLAKLWGRLEVPKKYPNAWKAVSEKLDSVLTWWWQQKQRARGRMWTARSGCRDPSGRRLRDDPEGRLRGL